MGSQVRFASAILVLAVTAFAAKIRVADPIYESESSTSRDSSAALREPPGHVLAGAEGVALSADLAVDLGEGSTSSNIRLLPGGAAIARGDEANALRLVDLSAEIRRRGGPFGGDETASLGRIGAEFAGELDAEGALDLLGSVELDDTQLAAQSPVYAADAHERAETPLQLSAAERSTWARALSLTRTR